MLRLLTEMSVFLLASTVLGLALGWIVRGLIARKDEAALEEEVEEVLLKFQTDREKLLAHIERLKRDQPDSDMDVGTYKIEDIASIGRAFILKLKASGIENSDDLLAHCSSGAKIDELAKKIDTPPSEIRRWMGIADVMRIPGIRNNFAEMISASGISSVAELAAQNPTRLTQRLTQVNEVDGRGFAVPTVDSVEHWIQSASRMQSGKKQANS